MSKAFTSEETEDTSIPGRSVARAAPGEERPITLEGLRGLVESRDALTAERAGISDETERRTLDHRLALVLATIESVRVVEPSPPDGTARFGSTLVLEWPSGPPRTVRLVGPDEADGKHTLSVVSPLGRALLGARAGSEVEVERPGGDVVVIVRRVE